MNDAVCFKVLDINKDGITLKHKSEILFIRFDECAKNYAEEKVLTTKNCVATRDVTKLTFTFYSNPKVQIVFKKNFFKDLFSKKSAINNFFELQKNISRYGYTTFDLS